MTKTYTAKLPTIVKLMAALKSGGFNPLIVGSVAKTGKSEHDIDILVDELNRQNQLVDDLLMELGFENITPRNTSEGDYWRSPGGLQIDIFYRKGVLSKIK